jgi:hypothetical protein
MEEHTVKLDRTLHLELGKLRMRIPAFGLSADDKRLLSHYRAGIEQQLANTGAILLVSVLEYSLRDFCNALKTWKNLKLSWSDLAGQPLERFKTYFLKVADVELDISSADWEEFQGLNVLRNVIVHELGELKDEYRKRMQRLLDANSGISIEDSRIKFSLSFCHSMLDKTQYVFGKPLGKIIQDSVQVGQK